MTTLTFLIQILLVLFFHISKTALSEDIKTNMLHQTKLPPCKSCRIFIESFKTNMLQTSTGKFEGGDTAWEEKKLGSYAKSEVRLVEIQEKICSNVNEGKDQCYALHEQYDNLIEEWWFNYQDMETDIFKYFCIDKMKSCCPEFHYGPDCLPCMGYPDNICNKNGKCKGAGTRKGNGKCNCESGYSGDYCDSCSTNYYISYKDDNKLLCSKCHASCDGTCTKEGPTGCNNCITGWIMDEDKACLDINECTNEKSVCGPLQFCVNTEGSFQCLECDRSCAGCTGDGPDMCNNCASGFILIKNMCVDEEQAQRNQYAFMTRYITYFGLCVATCIIFQRNVMLAAIVGLTVGVYISVSEYILNTPLTPNITDLVENLQLKF